MTEQELYIIYYKWTGQLHARVAYQLNEHVDVEFFPAPDWKIKVYSGWAEDREIGTFRTTPGFIRPPDEASEVIQLPRPEDNPTPKEVTEAFRRLCLAVARVLDIPVAQLQLTE